MGKYRLCQQYQEGNPCQIGEAKCTFCHSYEEMEFWEHDRDGSFNIQDFIGQKQMAAMTASRGMFYSDLVTSFE